MSFYDSEENCSWYENDACKDYDAAPMIARFRAHVPTPCKVLELGLGPGIDHDALRAHYTAVGIDTSAIFVRRYLARAQDANVCVADAVTLEHDMLLANTPFDAVYSNKVLHHLTKADCVRSLQRQNEMVRDGAALFHTLWFGDKEELMHGLRFQYYTVDSFKAILPKGLRAEHTERYKEMEDDDSIVVVLRKTES